MEQEFDICKLIDETELLMLFKAIQDMQKRGWGEITLCFRHGNISRIRLSHDYVHTVDRKV